MDESKQRKSNLWAVCDVDIDLAGGGQWTGFCQGPREHLEQRPLCRKKQMELTKVIVLPPPGHYHATKYTKHKPLCLCSPLLLCPDVCRSNTTFSVCRSSQEVVLHCSSSHTGLMCTAWEWKLLWKSFSDFIRTASPACKFNVAAEKSQLKLAFELLLHVKC